MFLSSWSNLPVTTELTECSKGAGVYVVGPAISSCSKQHIVSSILQLNIQIICLKGHMERKQRRERKKGVLGGPRIKPEHRLVKIKAWLNMHYPKGKSQGLRGTKTSCSYSRKKTVYLHSYTAQKPWKALIKLVYFNTYTLRSSILKTTFTQYVT